MLKNIKIDDYLAIIDKTASIRIKWPTYCNGVTFDGLDIKMSKKCIKCHHNECYYSSSKEGECSEHLRFFSFEIFGNNITIFGLRTSEQIKPKYPYLKMIFKPLKVNKQDIIIWIDSLAEYISSLETIEEKYYNFYLNIYMQSMHDTKRMVKDINNIAESIISKKTKDETISAQEIKSLHKLSSILNLSFDIQKFLTNPDSASFGPRHYHVIYKYINKIQNILYFSRNQKILLRGESHNKYNIYDSFLTLIYVLLDNAVKYSVNHGSVTIRFDETISGCKINIESTGPQILNDEKVKIFEKDFKGKYSNNFHSSGSGIGLHIANIIAKAHGTKIHVDAGEELYQQDSIPIANNIFSFYLSK